MIHSHTPHLPWARISNSHLRPFLLKVLFLASSKGGKSVRGDFILINVDTHSEGKVEGLSADNSAAVFVLLTPVAASEGWARARAGRRRRRRST